jgi:tetratricopeptide (TPR) repeat protein
MLAHSFLSNAGGGFVQLRICIERIDFLGAAKTPPGITQKRFSCQYGRPVFYVPLRVYMRIVVCLCLLQCVTVMIRHCLMGTRAFAVLLALLALGISARATSQAQPGASANGTAQKGIYLVFPFENAGASPRLDWLGEGLEELTVQYLTGAGQQVYSHAARTAELERNGFPPSARLSRASMLRIAQDLDADFVVFGSFSSDGKSLTVESRVLRLDPATLLPPIRETATLASLMDLQKKITWQTLKRNDASYAPTLAEFSKSQRLLRLDAFEHYIRGLLATDDETRLRELREASRLEPMWADVDFALGETYLARNDCNSALTWFSHVPKKHERYVEAVFSTGVCRLQLNQPDRAEEVFASLQAALADNSSEAQVGLSAAELPEIVNDLAVARLRQGKTAAAEADLRRASDLDPDEDDYPFNLGLLALRAKDFPAAATYFREASDRRAENPEDRALLIYALEAAGKKSEADEEREAARAALGPDGLPAIHMDPKNEAAALLLRIKTELDTTAIRFEIETPRTASASSGTNGGAGDTATSHLWRARQELSAGRLDDAEREFRATLQLYPKSAAAHRGLGEIQRRRGKLDEAIQELQASLQSRDSAVVRVLLARVFLEQKKPDAARVEAQRALKLAPNYTEAKQLLEHLQGSKPGGGAP